MVSSGDGVTVKDHDRARLEGDASVGNDKQQVSVNVLELKPVTLAAGTITKFRSYKAFIQHPLFAYGSFQFFVAFCAEGLAARPWLEGFCPSWGPTTPPPKGEAWRGIPMHGPRCSLPRTPGVCIGKGTSPVGDEFCVGTPWNTEWVCWSLPRRRQDFQLGLKPLLG